MLVVTPNLCFDRTLWVESFGAGTVARPYRVEVTAGGKGVNVARTVADLGGTGVLIGLVADRGGTELCRLLAAEGLDLAAVEVKGSVRSATIVIEDSQRATVLNEPGPVVGDAELEALIASVSTAVGTAPPPRLVVCSGSLPPGLPIDTYARIVRLVHERGGICVVDAARTALAAALPAGPDLVCPNLDEAEGLATGKVLESSSHVEDPAEIRKRALAAAHGLLEQGARRAVVTAGAHGVANVDDTGDWWTDAPRVTVANPIGAGDSFVGGLASALESGASWRDAVDRGVVVASAAVAHPRAGRVDARRVHELVAATAASPAMGVTW